MSHWEKQAQKWDYLGPPLKPCQLDLQNTQVWINQLCSTTQSVFKVLLLGVTPELVNLDWPVNTELTAVDINPTMLEIVLPKQAKLKPIGILGDWLNLPFGHKTFDLVIGDGCYSSLAEKNYSRMTKEIKRILKDDGVFIMRFFLQAANNDNIDFLLQELKTYQLTNFHTFKLRLAMSLHKKLADGVCLDDVWQCWMQYFAQYVDSIKSELKWDDAVINTIQHYQENFTYYTFPTLSEVLTYLNECFADVVCYVPQHELGMQCPTLKIRSNQ